MAKEAIPFGITRDSILLSYQIFVQVAESQSMSAASRLLDTEPSTISRHIASLEHAAGCALVERHRKGVTLTAYGQTFLSYAQKVLRLDRQVHEDLRAVRSGQSGFVRIAITDSAASGPISAVVAKFSSLFPEVKMKVYVSSFAEVETRLREGQADIGIGYRLATFTGGDVVARYEDPIVGVMSQGFSIANSARIAATDLGNFGLASFPLHSDLRRALAAKGVEIKPVVITDSIQVIKAFAAQGNGIGIVPASSITGDSSSGQLTTRPIELGEIPMDICAGVDSGDISTVVRFIEVLQNELAG